MKRNKFNLTKEEIELIANELTPLILELYDDFTCPNCLRKVPNKDFFRKKGCKWCVKND
jgi:hypothetical protein